MKFSRSQLKIVEVEKALGEFYLKCSQNTYLSLFFKTARFSINHYKARSEIPSIPNDIERD